MLTGFILLCCSVVIIATLAPLTHCSHWLVRNGDFPRVQLLILALAIGSIVLWHQPFSVWITSFLAVSLFACAFYQYWWIRDYTPLSRKEVKRAKNPQVQHQVTLLNANVLMTNPHQESLLTLVHQHQPDIVITLETNRDWQQALHTLQDYPYRINCPQDNLYGMHVLSKLPLSNTHVEYLVESDIPSIHTSVQLRNGVQVQLHCLHPAPPSPTENEHSSERDAELIIVAESLKGCHEPIIVAGDLNDVAWSKSTRLFRRISGLLDPRVGRGMFNTFHAQIPLLRWPLDHLFHSRDFQISTMKRLKLKGSDHFSLLSTLVYQNEQKGHTQEPDKDEDDRELQQQRKQEQDVNSSDVPNPNQ